MLLPKTFSNPREQCSIRLIGIVLGIVLVLECENVIAVTVVLVMETRVNWRNFALSRRRSVCPQVVFSYATHSGIPCRSSIKFSIAIRSEACLGHQ